MFDPKSQKAPPGTLRAIDALAPDDEYIEFLIGRGITAEDFAAFAPKILEQLWAGKLIVLAFLEER
jgi:hypothetical protein